MAAVIPSHAKNLVLRQNSMDVNGQTMNINVTSAMTLKHDSVYVESYLLGLIKILYAHIIFDIEPHAIYRIHFSVHAPHNSESCVYSMISLAKQSNFKVRRYDTIKFSHSFGITERIESVVINMSACDSRALPIWSLGITHQNQRAESLLLSYNTTKVATLHPLHLDVYVKGNAWVPIASHSNT